ncbi:hypothetical protein DL95DRAFT_378379 [Leptodontidium sp. 2 PMI_412]|nr:hypothetical protein DL95DRAFT_378379 [Leptodontidium sp. 2 PMI_412]
MVRGSSLTTCNPIPSFHRPRTTLTAALLTTSWSLQSPSRPLLLPLYSSSGTPSPRLTHFKLSFQKKDDRQLPTSPKEEKQEQEDRRIMSDAIGLPASRKREV